MLRNIVLIVFMSVRVLVGAQASWFVSQQNGSDSNDGLSVDKAFQTFKQALSSVSPGDTIFIVGEYHNNSYNPSYTYTTPDDAHLWSAENTIKIKDLHGKEDAYITIKSYDENTVLKGDGTNIVRVVNSSYLRFENLHIYGEVENIPLETAKALQFVYIVDDSNLVGTVTDPDPADIRYRNEEDSDGDHIVEETDTFPDISTLLVRRPSYVNTRGVYMSAVIDHVDIVNCYIHHMPGVGILVSGGKYINIKGNNLHNNSRRSYAGTHALVVTNALPIPTDDYSIRIENNLVHHNFNEQYSWTPSKTIITPKIDEGKGISLQKNNLSDWIVGKGRILVQNNITYWNGYSGIHSNEGYRIDFINNTAFMNSYTNTVTYANSTQSGNNIGISSQEGHDIKMINNISVVDASWGGFALSSSTSDNIIVKSNLIYGVNGNLRIDTDIVAVEEKTLIADPLFIDAPTDYQNINYPFDFSLQVNSKAINFADPAYAPSGDFFGNSRDNEPDAGAIEYKGQTTNIINPEKNKIKIYPNPCFDKIIINTHLQAQNISIYNQAGQNFNNYITIKSSLYTEINVKKLPKGMYILKIKNFSRLIYKQ